MKAHARVVLSAVVLLLLAASTAEAQSGYPYEQFSGGQVPSTDLSIREEREYRPGFQNGNAGFAGSEYPNYDPDQSMREYQRQKTEPSPPLDNGLYSSRPNPYCTNEPLCGHPKR